MGLLFSQNKIPKRIPKVSDLLGTDLKFPLQPSGTGDLATVSGEDNLYQSIVDILETIEGETLYEEDLGVGLDTRVHRSCNKSYANKLAFKIYQQIMKYENRIAKLSVRCEPEPAENFGDDDRIMVYGDYEDIVYHHPHNFIWPFILRKTT